MTRRPAGVLMRARNPCFRCRRLFLGCHVRFMSGSLLRSVPGALCGAPSTTAWRHPGSGQQHERGTQIRSPAQSNRAGDLQQRQDVKANHNTYPPSSTRPNGDALGAGARPLIVGWRGGSARPGKVIGQQANQSREEAIQCHSCRPRHALLPPRSLLRVRTGRVAGQRRQRRGGSRLGHSPRHQI
jgi:hypothetical protein